MAIDNKTFLAGCTILGLVVLESIAMLTGNDGAYFTLIVAAIAGVGGYSLAQQNAINSLTRSTIGQTLIVPPACPTVEAPPIPQTA